MRLEKELKFIAVRKSAKSALKVLKFRAIRKEHYALKIDGAKNDSGHRSSHRRCNVSRNAHAESCLSRYDSVTSPKVAVPKGDNPRFNSTQQQNRFGRYAAVKVRLENR